MTGGRNPARIYTVQIGCGGSACIPADLLGGLQTKASVGHVVSNALPPLPPLSRKCKAEVGAETRFQWGFGGAKSLEKERKIKSMGQMHAARKEMYGLEALWNMYMRSAFIAHCSGFHTSATMPPKDRHAHKECTVLQCLEARSSIQPFDFIAGRCNFFRTGDCKKYKMVKAISFVGTYPFC